MALIVFLVRNPDEEPSENEKAPEISLGDLLGALLEEIDETLLSENTEGETPEGEKPIE